MIGGANDLDRGGHGARHKESVGTANREERASPAFGSKGSNCGYVEPYKLACGPLPNGKQTTSSCDGTSRAHKSSKRANSHDNDIVATYDYRDENGALLFQVVRKPNHKFLQRRRTAGAPGKWTWSTKGVRRVLYRLPELIAANPHAPVFIPEGEKDVETLRAFGLTATCNPGGAGKWEPEYGEHLRGRDLVILPDNDQGGRDHAALVVRSLAGVARSIRVLAPPGLAEKGDVSNWTGMRAELLALVEATPETKPVATTHGPPFGNGHVEHTPERGAISDDDAEAMIQELNRKYFVVNENGHACIYAPRHDPILNRMSFERMSFADLEKLYANRTIQIGTDDDGKAIRRNAARLWIRHADRRQFIGGVVFDPSGRATGPDMLNLWHGFAVEPRAGSWASMQAHILRVICNSNLNVFNYLLDWMADLVQHPAQQGEVAVVLRGKEGCGKGTLAKALRYLFGQHGLAISNARHLTGNFNGHLRDVVFLFADEAFFAGDRSHVGVLKALVTEPYLTIESKYQNAVLAPNFLHVMMASNDKWVVPASLNSRRWLVLDVADSRIGDLAYFAEIYAELADGGYAAMLHDLLQRDLSASHLRAVPVTDALQEQRKRSVDTITAWWLDCLHRGWVFDSRLGLEDHWQQWHNFLPTEVLFTSYIRYAEAHRERHPLSREIFGRWLTSTGANPGRMSDQAIGEHLIDVSETDAAGHERSRRVTELIRHDRPYGYSIGGLDDARSEFERFTGLDIDWEGTDG